LSVNSPPVTVNPGANINAPGLPVLVPVPNGFAGQAFRAVVFNGSACTLAITGARAYPWLNPTQQAIYNSDSTTGLTIVGYGGAQSSGPVFVTWYAREEAIPDQLGSGSLTTIAISNSSIPINGHVVVDSGSITLNNTSIAVTGSVTLNSNAGVNIGTISLATGSTIALSTSSVTIGNVGTLQTIVDTVSVMDLPAVPIATVGGSGAYTTGTVPSGMKALLFTLSGPAPCLATVTGSTTNIIYAYQVPVSTITPTIVPIDPGTDASYTITFINPPPGAGIGICYAFSQPPILLPRSKLLASTYGQNVSGNVATWCGLFAPDSTHVTRLHSLRWTVASATSATGNSVCTIIIPVLGLTTHTVIRVNVPPAGATVSEGMNFGEEGVALIPGASNLAYFIGQTSSSAASIVALTAEYSLA
jgi:hypothetical protein